MLCCSTKPPLCPWEFRKRKATKERKAENVFQSLLRKWVGVDQSGYFYSFRNEWMAFELCLRKLPFNQNILICCRFHIPNSRYYAADLWSTRRTRFHGGGGAGKRISEPSKGKMCSLLLAQLPLTGRRREWGRALVVYIHTYYLYSRELIWTVRWVEAEQGSCVAAPRYELEFCSIRANECATGIQANCSSLAVFYYRVFWNYPTKTIK